MKHFFIVGYGPNVFISFRSIVCYPSTVFCDRLLKICGISSNFNKLGFMMSLEIFPSSYSSYDSGGLYWRKFSFPKSQKAVKVDKIASQALAHLIVAGILAFLRHWEAPIPFPTGDSATLRRSRFSKSISHRIAPKSQAQWAFCCHGKTAQGCFSTICYGPYKNK